jgi:hypothetical protein
MKTNGVSSGFWIVESRLDSTTHPNRSENYLRRKTKQRKTNRFFAPFSRFDESPGLRASHNPSILGIVYYEFATSVACPAIQEKAASSAATCINEFQL